MDNKTIRSYGEQALRDEAQAILDQIALLDDNFEKAVDMMLHALFPLWSSEPFHG